MKSSKIEWTRSTFNPWWGCEKVSPGCTNCYAEAFAKRVGQKVWGGASPRRFFSDKHWAEPVKWNAEAAKSGEPWRVFCASMADVFEDRRDLDAPRARVFDLIERTPALTWLLLTKRPENTVRLAPASWKREVPANVWRGVTCESPDYLWRVKALLDGPGGTTFVSYEPAVEAVSFGRYLAPRIEAGMTVYRRLSWVIVGGESGPGSRPFNLAWAREVVRECASFGVPCLVKQLGANPYDSDVYCEARFSGMEPLLGVYTKGNTLSLRDAKGGDWSEWPEDLRVREYPATVLS